MPNTTISQLPPADSADPNAVFAADNATGTITQKVTLAQVRALGPASHASSHSSVGSDPITPNDIGAAQYFHAGQHSVVGPDPISPASIGAASDSHSHSEATSSVAGFLSASDKISLDRLSDLPVAAIGTIAGSASINSGLDRTVQTLTLAGASVTLAKGSGWPSGNTLKDVVLRVTVTAATTITWSIVTDWFVQPPASLGIGTHLFLLRAVGASIVEGHYIGSKTN